MSNQAQRSTQIYEAFLASVNHLRSVANGTVTKEMGLTVPLHSAGSKFHNRT